MSQQLEVKSGEAFQVPLTGSAGTGFRWEIALPEAVAKHVTLVATERDAPSTIPGGPMMQRFHFQATSPGKVTLTFRYRRPWEAPDSGQIETVEVQIDPA